MVEEDRWVYEFLQYHRAGVLAVLWDEEDWQVKVIDSEGKVWGI